MKSRHNPFLRSATIAASILLSLAGAIQAQTTYYWDGGTVDLTTNGNGVSDGVAGNWNATLKNWDVGSASLRTAWVNSYSNTAVLASSVNGGNVNVSGTILLGTLNALTTGGNASYNITGGTLDFGSSGIITNSGQTSQSVILGSLLKGKITFTPQGGTLGTASSFRITNNNVDLTETVLNGANANTNIIIENAGALGTATATVKLTKGVLGLGNSATTPVSYNAWATELAGGAIRARLGNSTWNGATTLTANSLLTTRAAADSKLTFSSTGTINLNANTLTLTASNLSSGIFLDGAISGSGNILVASDGLTGGANGTGTVTLGAANSFNGTATTGNNFGTLALGNVNALQNATLDTAASGTQAVTFVAGTNTYNIGALTGSDALAIGGNTISVGTKAVDTIFAAGISGASGGLTKVGSNKLTLTAGTSYTGATQITGGTLALSGLGTLNGSSGITINGSGAKLIAGGASAVSPTVTLTQGTVDGTGSITTVNVANLVGNTVTNGNGGSGSLTIGTLAFSGAATVNLVSAGISAPLATTSLSTNAAGTVTINASAASWTNGQTYELISYGGGSIAGAGFSQFALGTVTGTTTRQSTTFANSGTAITLAIEGDNPKWTGLDDNGSGSGNWKTGTTGSNKNWKLQTTGFATDFIASDNVLFDDTATGVTSIDINAADVAPTTVEFNNSSLSYAIGSTGGYGISTGSLTKNGTASVTLSSVNTYTGTTTLNAGILRATTNASALGSGALVLAGGTLQLANDTGLNFGRNTTVSANTQITSDTLTSSAGVTHTLGTLSIGNQTLTISKGANATGSAAAVAFGATTLTGASTFSIGTNSTLSLGSVANGANTANFTGAGNLVQTGVWGNGSGGITLDSGFSGIATLSQANTYTGATTVNAGTLHVSGSILNSSSIQINGGMMQVSSVNAIANAGLINLADATGATFRVSGSETIGALSGGGSTGGNVTLDAGQTLTLSSGTQTYAGTISGSGVLTSSGAVQTLNGAISSSGGINVTSGRLVLGGNSSYTGQTSVSSGAGIVITANNALGAGGLGNETLLGSAGGGVVSGAIGLSGGVNYSTNEKIIGAGLGNTSANGLFAIGQRGLVQSISGNNTFAGDIEINATGVTRLGTQNGAQLNLSGTITAVTGATILIRAGDTNGDFVTLSGSGNSWEGDVSIFTGNNNAAQSAGLKLGANNAITTTSSVIGATSSGAANTFDMAGFDQILNGLGNGAQLRVNNNNSSDQSILTLNPNTDRATANTRIEDGLGTVRLVKQGNFNQTLAAANNYSGTTAIEAGGLIFGQTTSLYNGNSANWTKENIIVNSGATLGLRVGGAGEFTTSDVATIVSNLSSGINNNGLQGGSMLGLEVNAVTTYSNVIGNSTGTGSGSLGLVKTGSAGLTLDQNNTFTGGVTLNDGFLYAGHDNALGSGLITINTGGDRLAVLNGINIGNDIVINGGGTGSNGLIQNRNLADGENATVSGDVTINALTTAGGHFGSVGTGSTLTLTGNITSSVVVTQRTGTVIYSGGGSYAGFSITGTARLGADNGLATNATADLGLSANAVLDLAGYNQSLAGIVKNAANGASSAIVGNSSTANDSTLTVTGTSSYGGVIQDVVGSGNKKVHLTMNGAAQTLTLTGTNTYTGDTTIKAGTLTLGATGSLASAKLIVGDTGSSGAVLDVSAKTGGFTVGVGQTLSGIGTVDANDGSNKYTVTIAGTHAVGNSPGSQTIDGNLNYASGSIFEWDLVSSVNADGVDTDGIAGTDFDSVTATGTIDVTSGAIFKVVFGGDALTDVQQSNNVFWNTANGIQKWDMTAIFGSVFNSGAFTSVVTSTDVSTYGSFSITGSTLTWTAVPEPTSALAGLLIGAGLLRRRRQS